MRGSVKFYNEQKRYGFIKGEDDQDYFFHLTNLLEKQIPKKGDQMEFLTLQTEKGLQATNISILWKESSIKLKE